ncbi:GNAT family N-acetyltransferase [Xanthovirga aplysinae]|uniref:GNAT family N-acetyltransferase n=1 Tax=Xanthovirga aplysinae TaxID=2529853 RepID=UPI0012BB96B0|nr:GNAT family N-acetyltransferase [Xanthovirga aplysinae]MTI30632.1 GNAT family N-acetyltransferase [Xanthovirga aplysinae]
MNICFRKLGPRDKGIYRTVRLESLKKFPENFCSTYEEQKAKPKLAYEYYLEQEHTDKFVIGAFYKENLIGICGFNREEKNTGEIIQMYVKPPFQGNKVGLFLLKATLKEAFKLRQTEKVELDVLEGSKAAKRLYEIVGFVEENLSRNLTNCVEKQKHLRHMILHRKDFLLNI